MAQHPVHAAVNVWAVVGAAASTYAVGALIYGLFFSKLWLKLTGHDTAKLKAYAWRMALSPLPPLLLAIGLAMLFRAARIDTVSMGLVTGAKVWLFFLLPVRAYSFIYGGEKKGLLALDAVHLLLGALAAGAIIGGWL